MYNTARSRMVTNFIAWFINNGTVSGYKMALVHYLGDAYMISISSLDGVLRSDSFNSTSQHSQYLSRTFIGKMIWIRSEI